MTDRWRLDDSPDGFGCWIWTGHIQADGTPAIHLTGGQRSARRVVYEQRKGPIEDSKVLVALCGEVLCVRPSHHEPVTRREHARRCGRHALIGASRKASRRLRSRGLTYRGIGAILGVDEATVRRTVKVEAVGGEKA